MSVITERVEPRSIPSSVMTKPRFSMSNTHQCLVISRDQDRSGMLSRMATDGGWETTSLSSLDSAWRTFWGSNFGLAIVDSETASEMKGQLRELAEHISSQPDTLLLVCGTPELIEEELWARQCGAWMYLPGVRPDADLSTICAEALFIANKSSPASPTSTRV